MKTLISFFAASVVSLSVFAIDVVPGVSSAKVAELTAHRIDRLVTLGKIDAGFLNRFDHMEVSVVPDQAPAYYKVLVSQTAPAGGTPRNLEIFFDENGKPLSFQVLAEGADGPDLGWTAKDAVSLSENALHYVLENTADAKVALFDKSLKTFVLTKENLNGQEVAKGQMTSTLSTEKLNVYLTLDGTFISAEVVP